MTPYQEEQVQVLRRIAERGLASAQREFDLCHYVDIFQHLLDEIQRLASDQGSK